VSPDDRTNELVEKLIETTQDLFIFQGLESGLTTDAVRQLVRVNTDRVTRISKLRPKPAKTTGR
jgi:hypothetical protein